MPIPENYGLAELRCAVHELEAQLAAMAKELSTMRTELAAALLQLAEPKGV